MEQLITKTYATIALIMVFFSATFTILTNNTNVENFFSRQYIIPSIELKNGWEYRVVKQPGYFPTWKWLQENTKEWQPLLAREKPKALPSEEYWVRTTLPDIQTINMSLEIFPMARGAQVIFDSNWLTGPMGTIADSFPMSGSGAFLVPLPNNFANKPIYFRISSNSGQETFFKTAQLVDKNFVLYKAIIKDIEKFCLISFCIFFGFLGLLISLRIGDSLKIAKEFGFFTLTVSIYLLARIEFVGLLVGDSNLLMSIEHVSLFLTPIAYSRFFRASCLDDTFHKYAELYFVVFVIIALPGFYHPFDSRSILRIWQYSALPLMIISLAKQILEAIKGNIDARILSIGLGIVLSFAIFDIISSLFFIKLNNGLVLYGIFAAVVAMGIVVIRRIENTNLLLTSYSSDLQQKNIKQQELLTSLTESNVEIVRAHYRLQHVLTATHEMTLLHKAQDICCAALNSLIKEIPVTETQTTQAEIMIILDPVFNNANITNDVNISREKSAFFVASIGSDKEMFTPEHRLEDKLEDLFLHAKLKNSLANELTFSLTEGVLTIPILVNEQVVAVLALHNVHRTVHNTEWSYIRALAASTGVILRNYWLIQKEQERLLNMVSVAAQISDKINSPLCVIETISDMLIKITNASSSSKPENAKQILEYLDRRNSHLASSLKSLQEVSRELSHFRDTLGKIEATQSLFDTNVNVFRNNKLKAS